MSPVCTSQIFRNSFVVQCAQFIAPKSLTLNLAQLIAGSSVPKDTKALGVFVVTIHHAVGLQAQDRSLNPLALTSASKRENMRSADPYIVLAYAKFGKPLYTTRIVEGDLNPVWEETTVLLLTEDEVKGEEDLAVMLWDSDKRSADDLVGRVTVPVVDIMKEVSGVSLGCDWMCGMDERMLIVRLSPVRCTRERTR